MTPENPAPEPQKPAGQSRPAPPQPQRPAPPGSPAREPAPARRDRPLMLLRIGLLIGATVITFFVLGFLGVAGRIFGQMIVAHWPIENIKIKAGPTPKSAPAPSPVHTDFKTAPSPSPLPRYSPDG